MKRHVQMTGVRRWAGNDLVELQQQPLQAIDAFFAEYGNCILKGCEVTPGTVENTYNVTPGFVALAGMDQDNNETFKVVPFAGIEGVTLPIYLTLAYSVIERPYTDGKVKPIAYDFRAAASSILPENVPYLEISVTGGRQFVDAIRLTDKLDQTGNGRDVTVTFGQATNRENVSSGEKLSVLWGKVCRWFTDLKTVAFSGKAADLIDDENHRLTTDTEKVRWNDTYTQQETDDKDTEILKVAKEYAGNQVTDLGNDVYRKTDTYNRTEIETQNTAVLDAAKKYVMDRVGEVISGSPAALDTLYEIANALNNDPNFATTIMAIINGKADTAHKHTKSQITDFPSSLPASDVYAWAKQPNKPTYNAAEVGAATADHNHNGVYQPAGNYAPANHNHSGVYQPAGSYAAASHNHSADQISDTSSKVMMTAAERDILTNLAGAIKMIRVDFPEREIPIYSGDVFWRIYCTEVLCLHFGVEVFYNDISQGISYIDYICKSSESHTSRCLLRPFMMFDVATNLIISISVIRSNRQWDIKMAYSMLPQNIQGFRLVLLKKAFAEIVV